MFSDTIVMEVSTLKTWLLASLLALVITMPVMTFAVSVVKSDDPAIANRLEPIAKRLYCGMLHHNVIVVDSADLNAWVKTKDEDIYITTTLVKLCQNESEVAAVIGHELGHLQLGHLTKLQSKANQLNAMLDNLAKGGVDAKVIDKIAKAGAIAIPVFSRDQEYEADDYGFQALCQHGYDRNAMSALYSRLDAIGNQDSILSFLATHPPFKDRIERLTKLETKVVSYQNLAKNIYLVDPSSFLSDTPPEGYQMAVLQKNAVSLFVRSSMPVEVKKDSVTLPPDSSEVIVLINQPKMNKNMTWKVVWSLNDLRCESDMKREKAAAIWFSASDIASSSLAIERSEYWKGMPDAMLNKKVNFQNAEVKSADKPQFPTAGKISFSNPYQVIARQTYTPAEIESFRKELTPEIIKMFREMKKDHPEMYEVYLLDAPFLDEMISEK